MKKIGPSKQAAFDSKGNPTKAAIGFAKGQSVPVESLTVVQTEKGEYVCAVKEETGKPTLELLSSLLPKVILSIPFQKSMRWADVSIRFARPIHWILALFGGEVIPFEVGNVTKRKCDLWPPVHAPRSDSGERFSLLSSEDKRSLCHC